jgi:hypothetical protein
MKTNEIFNAARLANVDKMLSKKQIKESLKGIPYSYMDGFITLCVQEHLLIKYAMGYKFPKNPIYHKNLEFVIKKMSDRQQKYNNKCRKKAVVVVKDEIAEAIKLLQSTGEYEIYKIKTVITKEKL